ncbi:MAG: hypothetical protein RIR54_400, partial [Actinomycetota bacterium]
AAITGSEPITLGGPPNAKCTLTLSGKKASRRAVTLSGTGTATVAYSTSQIAALAKQLGLPTKSKAKPTISVSLACSSDSGVIPAKTRRLQLG